MKKQDVNIFQPDQESQPAPNASRCPQCQQPNQCDIANGLTTCWCFELETRDVGRQQKNTASQCLCRNCLTLVST